MKNVSVILNAILVVAVAVLFVLHFTGSGSKGTSGISEQVADSISVNKDIAYVQIDSLINSYDMYHDLKAELEKKAKQMDTELTNKGASFQKQLKQYQNDASKGLITRSEAEKTEQDLQRKQAELEKMSREMQAELGEQQGVMMSKIIDAVMKHVEKYNATKKYSLILNTSSANTTVMYGNPGMNITNDLIQGMNEEYIQNRSSASKE